MRRIALVLGLLASIFVIDSLRSQTPEPLQSVYSTAALRALDLTAAPFGVERLSVSGVPGDAPPVKFMPDVGHVCSADDGGYCVSAHGNGFWLAQYSTPADVREWGVDMSGATDSSAAMKAAAASGLSLFIPPGHVQFSGITITGNQQITCGMSANTPASAGLFVTLLQQNSVSGDLITFSGTAQFAGISNCAFQPIVRVTGNQIYFQSGCTQCYATNFWMSYVFNGILDEASGTTIGGANGAWSKMGSIYGTYGITFEGTNSTNKASDLQLTRTLINNAYPINPTGANVVTWATSTNYVQGNVTRINGAIYQESAATCTSASTGAGPSGFPSGTSPFNIFSGTIADGTCAWQFVSNSLIGYVNNSWGNSAILRDFTTLNNFESIKLLDNNNPGTNSAPQFPSFYNVTADHPYATGIDLEAGFDAQIYSAYSSSSLTLSGLVFGGTYDGIGKVIGGRFADNWESGIVLAVGTEFTVEGASVGSNSQAGSGSFNNIVVNPGIVDFRIVNNAVGKDPEAGNANALHGININTGASNYYIVTGNVCGGNTTSGCVADNGTGVNKTVSDNW